MHLSACIKEMQTAYDDVISLRVQKQSCSLCNMYHQPLSSEVIVMHLASLHQGQGPELVRRSAINGTVNAMIK